MWHAGTEYTLKTIQSMTREDVNKKDEDGNTPLHHCENLKIAKLLIEKGADLNSKNKLGETPLYFCGNVKIAKLFIEKGANVNIENDNGYTPLDNCIDCFPEVADVLIKNNAHTHSLQRKILKALNYADNYKNLVEKTETDINEKYLRDNVQNIKDHEKLKKEHQDYLKIRTEKKELRQDLKDIDALCNASQARLAEVYAKLPPQYQRSWVTKATMATIDTLEDLASERGIPNFVTNAVKGYINKRIHSTNFQQAFDTMSVFSGETAPEPELHRLERPNVHEAIAKIETPLQKLNSILPELTSDNITAVSDDVFRRLFDTSAIMAACDELDINERFKPLLKSLEIMPDEKFRDNSVLNHEKIFIATDLIKYSIRLGRGDIATDLMKHFIPKIKTGNPELMLDANETSDCFRQELSDITALSIELSKVNRQLNPVEKRKPLNKLLELTQATTIPEFTSYDPTEPMDIPVTGYLPEIINSTIADLGQGETETLKSLIKIAHDTNPDLVVTGNDIFNGQDKKILSLMLEKLRRSLNPNPLNEIMADFLTLYTAGHFAEGGGFSDSANDGQTQPLRVLDRLTNAVRTQIRYNDEPTILERLESKPAQNNEIRGFPIGKTDFLKAYRQSHENINRMKICFNQCPPKPFNTSITDNMARHRRQTHIGNV